MIVSQEKNLDLSREKGTGKYNWEVVSSSFAIAVQRGSLSNLSGNSFFCSESVCSDIAKAESYPKKGHREEDGKFSRDSKPEFDDLAHKE